MTFRAHISFVRAIQENTGREAKELLKFLRNHGAEFEKKGHPYLCEHSKKWKNAFKKALGVQARQLAQFFKDDRSVEEVVTEILKCEEPSGPEITRAAYAYAFLRCIYGVKGGEEPTSQHKTWIELLGRKDLKPCLDVIGVNWTQVQGYLEKSKNGPHLKEAHKKLSKADREVLAGLKFYQFYKLVIQPIPTGVTR